MFSKGQRVQHESVYSRATKGTLLVGTVQGYHTDGRVIVRWDDPSFSICHDPEYCLRHLEYDYTKDRTGDTEEDI